VRTARYGGAAALRHCRHRRQHAENSPIGKHRETSARALIAMPQGSTTTSCLTKCI
jgi:hypothetical protein